MRIGNHVAAITDVERKLSDICNECQRQSSDPAAAPSDPDLEALSLGLHSMMGVFEEHQSHIRETGEIPDSLIGAINGCERSKGSLGKKIPPAVDKKWSLLVVALIHLLHCAWSTFSELGVRYVSFAEGAAPPFLVVPLEIRDGPHPPDAPFFAWESTVEGSLMAFPEPSPNTLNFQTYFQETRQLPENRRLRLGSDLWKRNLRNASVCLSNLLYDHLSSISNPQSDAEASAGTAESHRLSPISKTVTGRALLIATDPTGAPKEYLKPGSVTMESRVSFPLFTSERGELDALEQAYGEHVASSLVSFPSSSSFKAKEDKAERSRQWTLTPTVIRLLDSSTPEVFA